MASKLSWDYPMEDPASWLFFRDKKQKGIDPLFAGRLSALAKYKGAIIYIFSGRRTLAEQVESYKQTGGYQDPQGNWTGGNGLAAKSGQSWHEYGQAVDVSDQWLKDLEKDEATENQKTFLRFGLYKPLTKGNKTSVFEDWHVQLLKQKIYQ